MRQPTSVLALALSCVVGGASLAFANSDLPPPAEHGQLPILEAPFVCGAKVVVSQAHGTFSHLGTDRWAWDFRVPEGTPILAAHDGVVRRLRSDSTRGGCDRAFGPEANYVILSAGNGFETQYLHFSKVFVREGQRIKAGEPLGEVGHTGFSCGPHLHFQLQRESAAWAGQSVPARFREIGDPQVDQEVVSLNCPTPSAPELRHVAAEDPRSVGAGGAAAPAPTSTPAHVPSP